MKFYIVQSNEQPIGLDLFKHLAELLALETEITAVEAKRQMRNSHGIIELSDEEKAKKLSGEFQKIGLDNFVMREDELVTFPEAKMLDMSLPEVGDNVGLVAAGVVLRETVKKEYGVGGLSKVATIDITVKKEAHRKTYVDVFTESEHFRINIRPVFYSQIGLWLKNISKNLSDVYLSGDARKILEGKRDLLTRFSEEKYYERYLTWLVQLKYAGQKYFHSPEVPATAEESSPDETESPPAAVSEQEEDVSKPHVAAGVPDGTVIGNHKILREIGRNDTGIVYRAEQISLARIVTMKVLPEHLVGDSSCIERFLDEARAMAALNHPNIVRTYNIGQDGKTYYYTMEFIEGTSVTEVLSQRRLPSLDRALRVVAESAKALAYMHQRGIVHRDIKSSTVVVDKLGRVKLTGFGLALQANAERVDVEGGIVGISEYMSPEQASGESATALSDIYSLGVVFYELLTGRAPFKADTPLGLVNKIRTEQPAPPRLVKPEIPPGVEKIVLKMIAKKPENRYPGCQEVLADLKWFSS